MGHQGHASKGYLVPGSFLLLMFASIYIEVSSSVPSGHFLHDASPHMKSMEPADHVFTVCRTSIQALPKLREHHLRKGRNSERAKRKGDVLWNIVF